MKYVQVEILEKGVKYVRSSDVFMIDFEYISSRLFPSVSIVHYEQINVWQELLFCVNIITQSLKMTRCFIQNSTRFSQ